MRASSWTEADSRRAREIWAAYQREHDLSGHTGEAVGIDPASGRVWFGASALDVSQQVRAQGLDTPLYFLRVGSDYYGRKGRHR